MDDQEIRTRELDSRLEDLQELLDSVAKGQDVERCQIISAQLHLSRAFMAYAKAQCFDCGKRTDVVSDTMRAADNVIDTRSWYD